jgi:hypothetical protein
LYTINPPPEENSHNAGSPLDANVRAVNVCGLANEKTKSRLDTPADNNAPGINDNDDGMVVVVDVVVVVEAKPGTSTSVDTKSPVPPPLSAATLNSNRADD